MGVLSIGALILLAVGAALAFRLLLDSLDRKRITRYLRNRGCQVLLIEWNLFAPGWIYNKFERGYRVQYLDAAGNRRAARCKTRYFTGVWWQDDGAASASRDSVR